MQWKKDGESQAQNSPEVIFGSRGADRCKIHIHIVYRQDYM
jgi:hypothetical protein